MTARSKKYQEAAKLLDKTKAYSPEEAIELAKKMAHSRFDETVELHLRMGLDPRNASQQVRGVALLPHGLGKQVRVLVFAQGEATRVAEAAGADRSRDSRRGRRGSRGHDQRERTAGRPRGCRSPSVWASGSARRAGREAARAGGGHLTGQVGHQ